MFFTNKQNGMAIITLVYTFMVANFIINITLADSSENSTTTISTTTNSTPDPCNETEEFTCKNGKCISLKYLCDQDDDCIDNSDEEVPRSMCPKCKLDSTEYQCENYKCIDKKYVCDGDDDCKDNSDESFCNGTSINKTRTKCLDFLFTCKISGNCITKNNICDKISQCGGEDTSDEDGCDDRTKCPGDAFSCVSGEVHCLNPYAKCDKSRDCKDSSDELNCPPTNEDGSYCSTDEYECKNHLCITETDLCDQNDDCLDNSDESGAVCDLTTQIHEIRKKLANLFENGNRTGTNT